MLPYLLLNFPSNLDLKFSLILVVKLRLCESPFGYPRFDFSRESDSSELFLHFDFAFHGMGFVSNLIFFFFFVGFVENLNLNLGFIGNLIFKCRFLCVT